MKDSSGDFSLVLPAAFPVDLDYRVYTTTALDLQVGPSNAAGTTVEHRRRALLFLVSRGCQQNKNFTQYDMFRAERGTQRLQECQKSP